MGKLMVFLMQKVPNSLAQLLTGLVLPPLWATVSPQVLTGMLDKAAQVIAGQTVTYASADEQDAVQGLVNILVPIFAYYGAAVSLTDVAPLMAALSTHLAQRFPAAAPAA